MDGKGIFVPKVKPVILQAINKPNKTSRRGIG